MGSKATGGVAERRLRPLWDAIDGRKYKSALKLASGLLAKHPDSPYLLVLKGLVLERLGKADEALALCQQARDKEPVDDLILSTLQIVYQRLNRLNEATLSYEVACTKCPSNLELMLALFNCYAREYNFVKQQQTAMKMYKAFGEERFLLWAVCNIYLQIQCGLGDGKKLLPLAEALLKKRIDSHGLQELEALLLYIAILQDLGMFETASDVLSGQLGGLFSIKIEKEKLKGEVLLRSHQYELAVGVYKEILLSSPDDWESILRFIDASLQVSSVNPSNSFSEGENQDGCSSDVLISPLPYHLSEDQVDERLMLVKTFLKELQVDDMKDLRRGPFLAMVEIENRILLYKLLVGPNLQDGKKNSSKSLAHSLIEYFKRFGHLPCFLPDIKKYLVHLEDSERHWVAEALDASCLLSQSEPPLRLLRRRIAAFHVEEQLGLIATMSERGIFAHAAKMIKLYLDCVEMSSGLDPQESMHGEELLVVASNLFIELFRRSQKLAFLLEALLILEFGLLIRRFNFNYKLILINLYSFLGAVGPAVDWYKTLDVKNILLETVSHHIMPALLGSLHWLDLESLLKEVIKFHEDYQKEAADFSILAYQHCNYSKVLEFVDLKRRLERSHNYALARIEAAILSLKQKVDNLDEVEALLASMGCGLKLLELSTEEKLSSLHFNEDLQTRPWWSPVPDESFLEGSWSSSCEAVRSLEDNQESPRKRHRRWRFLVRRRSMIPRLLFLVIKLSSSLNEREKGDSDNLEVLRTELRELLESYAKSLGLSWHGVNEFMCDLSSSKKTFKEVKMNPETVATLAVFYYAYQLSSRLAEPPCENNSNLICIDKVIRASIEEVLVKINAHSPEAADSLVPGNAIFSLCRLASEVLSWMGLVLQVWVKRLQPVFRKMKKGGSTLELTDTVSDGRLLDNLRTVTQSLCDDLEALILSLGLHVGVSIEQKAELLSSFLEPGKQKRSDISDNDIVPGSVLQILESSIDSLAISGEALQSWKPDLLVRKIVSNHHSILNGIKDMASAKLKFFRTLKF